MTDSKRNSDRRAEGEEAGQTQRRGNSAPQQAPKTGRSTRQGNKRATDGTPNGIKVKDEAGPNDDDGLPENARRRVPS